MSRNHKNNHYHYAEKYNRVIRREKNARKAYLPFKALIASLVVLMLFGFVTTTFGAYISENEPEYDPDKPGIISEVRNTKAARDVVVTGKQADLADTGAGQYNINWQGRIYFLAPEGWNLTSSSKVQVAITRTTNASTSSHIEYIETMFLMGGRLWCGYLNANHNNWNQNEYIAIVANSSAKSSGSAKLNSNTHYTGPQDYGVTNTAGVYLSAPTAATNGSSTNLTYNSDRDTLMLKSQEADVYTNGSKDGTGGSVTMSGYYFDNDWTLASSSDTSAGDYLKYDGALGTEMTISATADTANGYRFDGFYDTSNNLITNNSSFSYTITDGRKVVAKFIKTYTVTITKYSSQGTYTGTAPTVTGGGNTGATITVDTGTSVTMNSNISNTSLISCTFRKNSSSGMVISGAQTITSNTTIYACYTLGMPTISSFSYAGSPTTEGAAAISPDKSVKSADGGTTGTFNYSYSFVSSGSTGTAAGHTLTSAGAFSATYAGTYKIQLSVTNTYLGLTSSAATKPFTITVVPAAPTAAELEWSHDYEDSGDGTVSSPFKIASSKTKFYISAYVPTAQRNTNYTYNWTRADGTYIITDPVTDPPARTAGSSSATLNNNDGSGVQDFASSTSTDLIHNYDTGVQNTGYYYKVSLTKTRNNQTSDALDVYIYYGVTSDYLVRNYFDYRTFNNLEPIQKIYAEDNTITDIDADYDAGGSAFHTMLWFSKDNITYKNVAVWAANPFTLNSGPFASPNEYSAFPDDSAHKVDTLITPKISTVALNSVNLMSTTGPKWFKGFVDDYNNGNVAPIYPVLHTTVGTSSKVANRPVYFVDTTGVTHVGSRVMAFYLTEEDGNTVHYQTGQIVAGRSKTYRFYVPSDATKISFAYVADNNYVLPTYSDNQFSYTVYTDHTVLMAWTSTIDLSDEANLNKTAFVADTPGTADANGIYTYTNTADSGKMTTLS